MAHSIWQVAKRKVFLSVLSLRLMRRQVLFSLPYCQRERGNQRNEWLENTRPLRVYTFQKQVNSRVKQPETLFIGSWLVLSVTELKRLAEKKNPACRQTVQNFALCNGTIWQTRLKSWPLIPDRHAGTVVSVLSWRREKQKDEGRGVVVGGQKASGRGLVHSWWKHCSRPVQRF